MNANANVPTQPAVRSSLRIVLIAALLLLVGGGAGFIVLSGGERETIAPAEVRQAEPQVPHVASSSEWAPPVSDGDAGGRGAP